APSGSFIVTDTLQFGGSDEDIEARMYDSSGNFVRQPFFGAITGDVEIQSSVAINVFNNFDIAWDKGSGTEVRVAQFSRDGTLLSTSAFSSPGAGVTHPSVALDNFNNAVVAYGTNSSQGDGGHAKARRVFSSGFVGPEITVSPDLFNPFPN